jgi:sodium/bile acid cotransporter 3/5
MFGGNLDLSVTMTAVSTFSAFFMMPLWVFLLGEVIVAGTHISDIPYFTITKYAVLLVVPLLIGISIRKCLPKVANIMVRFMKPLALFLIVFILVCGIWSQFFMLKLITWRTALVGFALPWLGFGFGCLLSKFCNRERKDIIAIAIETGIQNTGMSIFMLWHSLDHPAGDLAAVVPVAVATLTPVPLLAALAYYRARASYCPLPSKEVEVDTEELQEKTGKDMDEKKKEMNVTQENELVA